MKNSFDLKQRSVMFGVLALALSVSACSSPEQKLAKYTEEGLEFLEEGKMGRANVQLQNALKIDEEHVPALVGIAEIAESRSDFQSMFGILQKIARLQPDNVDAQIKLAKLHLLGSERFGNFGVGFRVGCK